MGTIEENFIENFVCFIYGGSGAGSRTFAPAPAKKYRYRYWLRPAPAPQHWLLRMKKVLKIPVQRFLSTALNSSTDPVFRIFSLQHNYRYVQILLLLLHVMFRQIARSSSCWLFPLICCGTAVPLTAAEPVASLRRVISVFYHLFYDSRSDFSIFPNSVYLATSPIKEDIHSYLTFL